MKAFKLTAPTFCQDPECNCADEKMPAGSYAFRVGALVICDGCVEERKDAESFYQANKLDMEGR